MSATVAVLAGGRSRRMGAPKALAPLAGAPLIARPLAAAQAAALPVIVVAKPDSPLPGLDVPVVREPAEPTHPLCGLVAALEHVAAGCDSGLCGEAELAAGAIVAVACDQPWVTGAVLSALAGRPEPVAVPLVDGRLEPFPGRYDARVLAALRAALAEQASMRATLAALGAAAVDLRPCGDPARLVASVNTPDELAAAQ
jgi:molybdopterin-guanine dinucleotide biosynthesis protein A